MPVDVQGAFSSLQNPFSIRQCLNINYVFKLFQVVDLFDFDRELVAISISLFERYISTLSSVQCWDRQLICLTSLYIAVKTHGPGKFRIIETFVKLGQGQFSQRDIEAMETKMLFALKWLVNPPTAQMFIKSYLDIATSSAISKEQKDVLVEKATYIIENMICKGHFIHEKNSSLALASLVLALSDIDENIFSCISQRECLTLLQSLTNISLNGIKHLVHKFQEELKVDGIDLRQVSYEIDPNCLLFGGFNAGKSQDSKALCTAVPRSVTPTQSPI